MMSTHKCSQCPGTKPQPSLLLPLQIPDELKVMIVAKMVVPERAYWDWQLKVDWESLPNLKHLVLDLRTYSALSDAGALFEIDEILAAGARRMRGLNLKSLIIYGLCSSDLTRDVLGKHQQVIKSLFEGSLATDGTLELRDEEAPTSDW
ncbi:hypothetical protein PZA11_001309 [Diplocarpon coronariae]